MKIEKGRRVTLKVDLSVAGGQQLEKNQVEFIHGSGAMLPGLETVLAGLEKGAKREGVLKAKDAFGNAAMHPLKKMKRSEFPKDARARARRAAGRQGRQRHERHPAGREGHGR